MKARLLKTGNEYAPYELRLEGESKIERRLLQSWVNGNPLGESFSTGYGWLRIRAEGTTQPKVLDQTMPDEARPERVEERRLALEEKAKKQAALEHAQRFERAVVSGRARAKEWVREYREARKQLRAARKRKREKKKEARLKKRKKK